MDLKDLLVNKKSVIANKWVDSALESYPTETSNFLKKQKNRFTNPIGYNLSAGLEKILDGILQDLDMEELISPLDNIVRVTAVQGLSASQALRFFFSLKRIIRDVAGTAAVENREELDIFDARVDALVLAAFDIFMKCREKIYEVKADEMKNMTFRLLQRANQMFDKRPHDNGSSEQADQNNEAR